MWRDSPGSPVLRLCARGFSLIELLITIALISVLMSIAVPSFRDYQFNSQASTLANEFVMGTMYARAEAISKNRCVTMCMSADAQAESPTCVGAGGDWNVGWIVFSNPRCDNNPSDTTAELLKVYMGEPSRANLVSNPTTRSVRFDSRGMTTVAGAAEFRLTPTAGSWKKSVCLSSAGRARIVDALSGCSGAV